MHIQFRIHGITKTFMNQWIFLERQRNTNFHVAHVQIFIFMPYFACFWHVKGAVHDTGEVSAQIMSLNSWQSSCFWYKAADSVSVVLYTV